MPDDVSTPTPPTPPGARPLEPEEKAKLAADVIKVEAETAGVLAHNRVAEAEARTAEIALETAERNRKRTSWADGYEDRSYLFGDAVATASVTKCMSQLAQWHRENPECEIEVIFDSPGGSVVDGLHLYDYLIDLQATHRIVTRTRGMAASMAGILLQAGTTRVMGPQASLMIHEASFGASGKMGDVEDTVEWVKKVQERILQIFADRSATSGAEKPLSKTQLRNRWRRKNWWLDADEALKFGLVDEVR